MSQIISRYVEVDARHLPSKVKRSVGPNILMTPDYRRDNPYQSLLAKALKNCGARVSFPRGYRRVLPLRRMLGQDGPYPEILHLHWLAPYLKGRSAAMKMIYAAKLILDVLLVRRAGVRLVWTVHNFVDHEQTHPGIELWCRRRLAQLTDAIVVHSDRAKEHVGESYNALAGKIAVMPHGHYRNVYGPSIASAEARKSLDLPQEGCVFLFFGMIRPYKGVLKLLSSWAETPELRGRHTLVVAGEALDPGYRDKVRAAAETVPGVRLRLGRVPDDRVAIFLSAADALVVPSKNVLTSGSAILAESYGKSTIAPKLSGDTGASKEREHPDRASDECEQLAMQMAEFARDPTAAKLGCHGSPAPSDWGDASVVLMRVVRETLDGTSQGTTWGRL